MKKDRPIARKEPRPRWVNATPPTLGAVFDGAEELKRELAAREAAAKRRAELDAAGFKPLKGG